MRNYTDMRYMEDFGSTLLKIRKKNGHKSARSFCNNFIQPMNKVMNYSYYKKIENSEVLPSAKVVEVLASFFNEQDADALILSYCKDLFPKRKGLFKDVKTPQLIDYKESQALNEIEQVNIELSALQVSVLASKREIYEVFQIASLARRSIDINEVEHLYDIKKLKSILTKLNKTGLIERSDTSFKPSYLDYVFPKADTVQLQNYFKKFDLWDMELASRLELEEIFRKSFTKRISLKYLSIIQGHLDVLFDIVRATDELESKNCDRVIQLSVNLSSGKLPG